MTTPDERSAKARRIVDANMYMTIATADGDGRPWATPVWYAPAGEGELLWVSVPEARHSRNIARRPEIAIVIFDSTVPVGGAEAVYVEATAEQLTGEAVGPAIATFSERSQACGANAWQEAEVLPPAPLRLYRATASARYVLGPHDRRLPVLPASG
jgi:nitroimidazol reductase NimA-like FMN-containing flavoprotein (pyridoxamine 5'-phosphate oxidase superfamily)